MGHICIKKTCSLGKFERKKWEREKGWMKYSFAPFLFLDYTIDSSPIIRELSVFFWFSTWSINDLCYDKTDAVSNIEWIDE